MNDVQLSRRFRALRQRLRWRQSDVALRAQVSQSVISDIERGRFERVSLPVVRRAASVLDAEFVLLLRWRGGDLDRMMDEGHAALVGAVIKLLTSCGWLVRAEVSYSEWGERGSIDILAWDPDTRTLLVVEVKTELVSIEETLRKHDEKSRLAPKVAREQLEWQARTTARLLVLPDQSTPRHSVERHDAVLRHAYPVRGMAVRAWLKSPSDPIAALAFVSLGSGLVAISRKRVRCRRAA